MLDLEFDRPTVAERLWAASLSDWIVDQLANLDVYQRALPHCHIRRCANAIAEAMAEFRDIAAPFIPLHEDEQCVWCAARLLNGFDPDTAIAKRRLAVDLINMRRAAEAAP